MGDQAERSGTDAPTRSAAVGSTVPERSFTVDQATVLRYAGASGDFNPLHWDAEVAERVSPTGGVIAHGMLSLGLVSTVVTEWAGGPERVLALDCSFKAPCPVGSTVTVGGEVVAIDDDADTATLKIWVRTDDGAKVIDARSSRAVIGLGRSATR